MHTGSSARSLRHIAVIMDGNGRWAKQRGLPRHAGHRQGAEAVRECLRACRQRGIEWLTLYAFSEENWKRSKEEVTALMGLLVEFLSHYKQELHERGIRLHIIGERAKLPPEVQQQLQEVCDLTRGNTALNLVVALSYGSRQEMVRCMRKIASGIAAGELQVAQIDEELISANLDTAGMPDPDLLIRTSGEKRLSNFLLWQISYAEILVLDKFWPDFTAADIDEAIAEYQRRDRRFGACSSQ